MNENNFNTDKLEKIYELIKKYELESIAQFLLEIIYPFRRIIGSIVLVAEPFLSIFINPIEIEFFYKLFYEKDNLNKLKELLEKEN
ncbi:MAG: hypothetical protein ACP5RD_02780 [bacterium]|jgi:hypothetical protein